MRAIADTGLLVAFLNRDDKHSEWAGEIARRISGPLLTCEAVLAETAYLVGSSGKTLELVQRGFVEIAFELAKNFDEIADLASRYRDRKPDLADLCLIRMSELHKTLPIITVDEADFRVYRRNGRDVIPIICPPRN